jgi:hypothetical protein
MLQAISFQGRQRLRLFYWWLLETCHGLLPSSKLSAVLGALAQS